MKWRGNLQKSPSKILAPDSVHPHLPGPDDRCLKSQWLAARNAVRCVFADAETLSPYLVSVCFAEFLWKTEEFVSVCVRVCCIAHVIREHCSTLTVLFLSGKADLQHHPEGQVRMWINGLVWFISHASMMLFTDLFQKTQEGHRMSL